MTSTNHWGIMQALQWRRRQDRTDGPGKLAGPTGLLDSGEGPGTNVNINVLYMCFPNVDTTACMRALTVWLCKTHTYVHVCVCCVHACASRTRSCG